MIFKIMGYIFCLLSCKKIGRKGEIPEEKRDGVGTISDKNDRVGTFSEKKYDGARTYSENRNF